MHDKFRNQQIEIIIAVPKNGRIKVDESAKGYGYDEHFEFFNHNWNYDSWEGNDEPRYYDFRRGVEYKMTQDGKLERTDGFRENDNSSDNNNDENNNNAVQPDNSNKAQSDSTNTYHYKTPAAKQAKPAAPAKPANKKADSTHVKEAKAQVRQLNSPLAFVERFTI